MHLDPECDHAIPCHARTPSKNCKYPSRAGECNIAKEKKKILFAAFRRKAGFRLFLSFRRCLLQDSDAVSYVNSLLDGRKREKGFTLLSARLGDTSRISSPRVFSRTFANLTLLSSRRLASFQVIAQFCVSASSLVSPRVRMRHRLVLRRRKPEKKPSWRKEKVKTLCGPLKDPPPAPKGGPGRRGEEKARKEERHAAREDARRKKGKRKKKKRREKRLTTKRGSFWRRYDR